MAYSNTSSNARRPGRQDASRTGNIPRGSGGNDRPRRSNPTDKMLSYARKLADELNIELPAEAEANFEACRDFIDGHADTVPPTEKQIEFAERLAEAEGIDLPDETRASKRKLSAWLDEHAPQD